jgi:CRP-like cAMP-binding protein
LNARAFYNFYSTEIGCESGNRKRRKRAVAIRRRAPQTTARGIMKLNFNLPNGKPKFIRRPIKNTNGITGQPAFENLNSVQMHLFREVIDNELLRYLTPADLQDLLSIMEPVYLDKQEYVYQPDDLVHNLYFPESAVISEFQILEDGKTIEIAMTGREGAVGVTAILDSHPPANWAQVLIPGKAWRVNAPALKEKIGECAAFQRNIYKYIDSYISHISQRIVCGVHHTVEERLCCWLLMIRDRCGGGDLSLTQEQIARFLGVHRPSITLITQSLREQQVIDYVRGRISIIDKQKLENLACACYLPLRRH